jgi:hypothetical protein
MILGTIWVIYAISSNLGSAACGMWRFLYSNGIIMVMMVIGLGVSLLPLIWLHTVLVRYVVMAISGFLLAG